MAIDIHIKKYIVHPLFSMDVINESIGTPDQSGEKVSRRTMLKAGAASIVAMSAITEGTRRAGVWRTADLGFGTLGKVERELNDERARFGAEYLLDPDAEVDTNKAMQLLLRTELVRYLREHPKVEEIDFDTFMTTLYRPFMDGVRDHSARRSKEQESDKARIAYGESLAKKYETPSIGLISQTKLALHDQLGEKAVYFAKSNNIIDGIRSQEIQCRSGSRLLLLAVLENVESKLQSDERLVSIHTNQHVQLGLLTADEHLIAFEMTKAGMGVQELGLLKEISTPILVTDAKHDLAQSGLNQQAHTEQAVLLNSVPEKYDHLTPVAAKGGHTAGWQMKLGHKPGIGGALSATTDQYGFADGTVEIPEQRIPLTVMDAVPSSFSTSRENTVGDTQNVYQTLDAGRDEYRVLFDLMTSDERRVVTEFQQYRSVYAPLTHEIGVSYSRIIYDQHCDIPAEIKKMGSAIEKLIEFINVSDLDRKYAAYKAALDATHKRHPDYEITFSRNPREYVQAVIRHVHRHIGK